MGKEENEGFDLVEGFPEAACAKVCEPALRLLKGRVLEELRFGASAAYLVCFGDDIDARCTGEWSLRH